MNSFFNEKFYNVLIDKKNQAIASKEKLYTSSKKRSSTEEKYRYLAKITFPNPHHSSDTINLLYNNYFNRHFNLSKENLAYSNKIDSFISEFDRHFIKINGKEFDDDHGDYINLLKVDPKNKSKINIVCLELYNNDEKELFAIKNDDTLQFNKIDCFRGKYKFMARNPVTTNTYRYSEVVISEDLFRNER